MIEAITKKDELDYSQNRKLHKIRADKGTPKDDIIKWMYDRFHDPYQIRSPYDCTGKAFVQGVTLYKDIDNGSMHSDYDYYVVEQTWAKDI